MHGEKVGAAWMEDALARLRDTVAQIHYPLNVASAEAARQTAGQLIARIDDYLVPRVARRDAALLVVVGGPTGAGKSTLVNSLVGAPVSRPGVLRPTTRTPVLVCHPSDMPWFSERPLLPGLQRTRDLGPAPDSLRLIAAPGLPPGLALLDAPDVDSVVDRNRALADRLLAAADLWLFVTTAARYADAVPSAVLRGARDRGTAVALVLDRVPPGAEDEVTGDFGAMLDEQGMGDVHLFALPEVVLNGQGLLADRLVRPLRTWLAGLAEDPVAHADVVAQTMSGALAGTDEPLRRLALAANDQLAAAAALEHEVSAAVDGAGAAVIQALRDGVLLRGDVLARWRGLIGDGRQKPPDVLLARALFRALADMLTETALAAAERVHHAWRTRPEGRDLLDRVVPVNVPERVIDLVLEWEREVEGIAGKPAVARQAFTLALLEGAPEVPRILGTELDPGLVGQTRTAMLERVQSLLSDISDRFLAVLNPLHIDPDLASRLSDLARTISKDCSASYAHPAHPPGTSAD
jgi:energy-coupling factor transporter ATP-binding protein EcfA2